MSSYAYHGAPPVRHRSSTQPTQQILARNNDLNEYSESDEDQQFSSSFVPRHIPIPRPKNSLQPRYTGTRDINDNGSTSSDTEHEYLRSEKRQLPKSVDVTLDRSGKSRHADIDDHPRRLTVANSYPGMAGSRPSDSLSPSDAFRLPDPRTIARDARHSNWNDRGSEHQDDNDRNNIGTTFTRPQDGNGNHDHGRQRESPSDPRSSKHRDHIYDDSEQEDPLLSSRKRSDKAQSRHEDNRPVPTRHQSDNNASVVSRHGLSGSLQHYLDPDEDKYRKGKDSYENEQERSQRHSARSTSPRGEGRSSSSRRIGATSNSGSRRETSVLGSSPPTAFPYPSIEKAFKRLDVSSTSRHDSPPLERDPPSLPPSRRASDASSLGQLARENFIFQGVVVRTSENRYGERRRHLTEVKTLVDTGSDVNVIHKSVLTRAKLDTSKVKRASTYETDIGGVNGFSCTFENKIKLKWGKAKDEGSMTQQDTFYIADDLPNDIEMIIKSTYLAEKLMSRNKKHR